MLQVALRDCMPPILSPTPPTPENRADTPPAKKMRSSLFAHYAKSTTSNSTSEISQRSAQQLNRYIEAINSTSFCEDNASATLSHFACRSEFNLLQNLFQHVLCSPASSAPVERVFSQS